jgi:hypothetical protein
MNCKLDTLSQFGARSHSKEDIREDRGEQAEAIRNIEDAQ